MVLAPLPAGKGRHAASPAQRHHNLPPPYPGHIPPTKQKPHFFLGTTPTPPCPSPPAAHLHISLRHLTGKPGQAKTKSLSPSFTLKHGT